MKRKKLTKQQETALREERAYLEMKVMAGMSTREDHQRAMDIKKLLYF